MDFKKYFKKGIQIVKLDKQVISEISKDKDANLMAVLFFAIGGFATAIMAGPPAWIGSAVGSALGSFIGVGIIHLLAKLFGGKASFMEFYRPLGIGNLLTWVPALGGLLGLWNIVISVVALEETHKLSRKKAIIVVLIPVIAALIIGAVLFVFLVSIFTAIFGGAFAGIANNM